MLRGLHDSKAPRRLAQGLASPARSTAAHSACRMRMGATGTLADFARSAVLVFFGLTQRPVVCLAALSRDIDLCEVLGADGDKIQVVFVTVASERDMSAVLRMYMKALNPNFAALHGDACSYTMDHAAASYAFVPQGLLRLLLGSDLSAEDVAPKLRVLPRG
jgi:protein SCO1/2